jgi:hypothetical protein
MAVSDEDLQRFIEAYQVRRELVKLKEAEQKRQQDSDIYGVFAKYQKRKDDYRGRNKK